MNKSIFLALKDIQIETLAIAGGTGGGVVPQVATTAPSPLEECLTGIGPCEQEGDH
jgi:hypothetical protein